MPADPLLSRPWHAGTSGRALWAQQGEEPSAAADTVFALTDSRELAKHICQVHNAWLEARRLAQLPPGSRMSVGEERIDPEDGNAYRLVADSGGYLHITDIYGGHERRIAYSEWVKWQKVTQKEPAHE